jgi:acyl-CoA synthetase (AMP-forming)/AMP-acid ligase II
MTLQVSLFTANGRQIFLFLFFVYEAFGLNIYLIDWYTYIGYEVMFRTGDFGRILNDQLYYFGRADSQVKIRGHRVDLSEINAAIEWNKLVSTCVVLSYKAGEPEQVSTTYAM